MDEQTLHNEIDNAKKNVENLKIQIDSIDVDIKNQDLNIYNIKNKINKKYHVIALHGTNDNPMQMSNLFAGVFDPNIYTFHPLDANDYGHAKGHWYDSNEIINKKAQGEIAVYDFLADACLIKIKKYIDNLGISLSDIILCGYAEGGIVASALAVNLPDDYIGAIYKACITVNTTFYQVPVNCRTKFIRFATETDDKFPPAEQENANLMLKNSGIPYKYELSNIDQGHSFQDHGKRFIKKEITELVTGISLPPLPPKIPETHSWFFMPVITAAYYKAKRIGYPKIMETGKRKIVTIMHKSAKPNWPGDVVFERTTDELTKILKLPFQIKLDFKWIKQLIIALKLYTNIDILRRLIMDLGLSHEPKKLSDTDKIIVIREISKSLKLSFKDKSSEDIKILKDIIKGLGIPFDNNKLYNKDKMIGLKEIANVFGFPDSTNLTEVIIINGLNQVLGLPSTHDKPKNLTEHKVRYAFTNALGLPFDPNKGENNLMELDILERLYGIDSPPTEDKIGHIDGRQQELLIEKGPLMKDIQPKEACLGMVVGNGLYKNMSCYVLAHFYPNVFG